MKPLASLLQYCAPPCHWWRLQVSLACIQHIKATQKPKHWAQKNPTNLGSEPVRLQEGPGLRASWRVCRFWIRSKLMNGECKTRIQLCTVTHAKLYLYSLQLGGMMRFCFSIISVRIHVSSSSASFSLSGFSRTLPSQLVTFRQCTNLGLNCSQSLLVHFFLGRRAPWLVIRLVTRPVQQSWANTPKRKKSSSVRFSGCFFVVSQKLVVYQMLAWSMQTRSTCFSTLGSRASACISNSGCGLKPVTKFPEMWWLLMIDLWCLFHDDYFRSNYFMMMMMMMVTRRNRQNPALARAMARHISSGRSARMALELQYQKGYPGNLEVPQSHLLINIRRHEVTLKFREFLPEGCLDLNRTINEYNRPVQ